MKKFLTLSIFITSTVLYAQEKVVNKNGKEITIQNPLTLTTTGSGAATFTPSTAILNIPTPSISGTTNYVSKFTGSTTLGDSQLFDNGTNVGIGTASPLSLLHLYKPTGGTNVYIENGNAVGGQSSFDLKVSTSSHWRVIGQGSANGNRFDIYNNIAGGNAAFSISSIKNIGLDNPNPTQRLDVNGNVKFSGALMPNNNAGSSGQVLTSSGANTAPTWQTVATDNLYTANGTLSANRTVTQGANTLAFTGTSVNAFSVDGNTFSVDASNNRVGIGTASPTSKLEVDGAATNKTAFNAAAGTTIDFSKSNLAYTTASAGSFTLNNIKDGGTYTLAVQGGTSGTSSFTSTGFTFKYVNSGATTAGKHTLYTLLVMGSTVYVYMATGF